MDIPWLHVLSTLVVIALFVGLSVRKRNPGLHWKIMVGAFVVDVAMVLCIELTRQAVERVVGEVHWFIWFHAGISTMALVLYVVAFVLGRKLLLGNEGIRRKHMLVGITFMVFRLTNYVTSFFV